MQIAWLCAALQVPGRRGLSKQPCSAGAVGGAAAVAGRPHRLSPFPGLGRRAPAAAREEHERLPGHWQRPHRGAVPLVTEALQSCLKQACPLSVCASFSHPGYCLQNCQGREAAPAGPRHTCSSRQIHCEVAPSESAVCTAECMQRGPRSTPLWRQCCRWCPGLSYFRFCCEDPRCGIELDEIDPEQWALLEVTLSMPADTGQAFSSTHMRTLFGSSFVC